MRRAVIFGIWAGVAACAEATTSPAPTASGVVDAVEPPPSRPPTLEAVLPQRATWFETLDPVTVSGEVVAGTTPVSRVEVNGATAVLEAGRFAAEVPVEPGVNLVGLRAVSDDGRAVDGRALHAGPRHPPGVVLPSAVAVHWSPLFLDDDDPDLDDLATAAESLLTGAQVLEALVGPIDTEYATITPTAITVGSAGVDLNPADGGLLVADVRLAGLVVNADVDGKSLVEVLSGPATVSYTKLDAHLELELAVEGGVPRVVVRAAELTPEGFAFTSAALEGTSDGLKAALTDVVEDLVTEAVGNTLTETLTNQLPGLLEGLAYTGTFFEDSPVAITLALEQLSVDSHGVRVELSALFEAPNAAAAPSGSLRLDARLPAGAFSTEPIAVAISLDALNQALAAAWSAGIATRVLEGDSLASLGPDVLPDLFQPTERVTLSAGLPPTLIPRANPEAGHPFTFALGELAVVLDAAEGLGLPARHYECVLGARGAAGVERITGEDGSSDAVRVNVDARPRTLEVVAGCPVVPEGHDPGDLAALLRLGLPAFVASATGSLSIPLPGLPLGAFVTSGPLVSMEVVLTDGRFGTAAGALTLEGSAAFRSVTEPAPPRQ